ncbi:DUF4189 domain-containing protein [Nocardia cerradoensis]|nr:DUF4189 domain-containing protein [Nocardia cerradoensis]
MHAGQGYPAGVPYPGDPNQPPMYGQAYPPGGYPEGGYPGGQSYAQPYPDPQYGGQPYPYPGAPQQNSGGGKVLAIVAAVVAAVLVLGAVVAVIVVHNHNKNSDTDAAAQQSTTTRPSPTYSTSTAPTTRETTRYAPPPPPATPADVWIAAGYDADTGKVTWARSTVSSDDATNQVQTRCPGCAQPAAWARNACVAVVVGQNNGWASTWGTTAEEAESKAVTSAQDNYGVTGPFNKWSKCATE